MDYYYKHGCNKESVNDVYKKIIKDKIPTKVAKISAFFLEITPVTIGRLEVLAINLSRSLSMTMLKALALPAAKVPAKIVAIAKPKSG
jgi:hypothetical protein